jgi:hypothetical protein
MLDEPTSDDDRVARARAQRAFVACFVLGVVVAVAWAAGLGPAPSRAPTSGVRGVDDSLVEKSGPTQARRLPERDEALADDLRPAQLEASSVAPRLEEPRRPTPIDEFGMAKLLVETHHEIFGEAPTLARISVAWAHLALEHNRGREVENNNYGNLSVPETTKERHYVRELSERTRKNAKAALGEWKMVKMRFRAFSSARDGMRAYWTILRDQYPGALQLFNVGNAHHAGRKLADLGYATQLAEPYAVSMGDLQGEFRMKLFSEVAKLDVQKEFRGKLETPGGDAVSEP